MNYQIYKTIALDFFLFRKYGAVSSKGTIKHNFVCFQNIFILDNHAQLQKRRRSAIVQFVIFNPLSYCFEEIIGFDVKALFASRPVSRLIM